MEDLPGRALEGRDERRRFGPVQLDGVGVDGHPDPVQLVGPEIDRDRHDERPRPGRGNGPEVRGEGGGLGELEGPRRARDEVEADRVGAGPDGRLDAGPVGDPADLHERDPVEVGRIRGLSAGGHERPGCGLRVRGANQRLTDEDGVEAEGSPATHGRGFPDPGLGNHQPVLGHPCPKRRSPLRIDPERPEITVVEPDEPRPGRQGGLELALVVSLDERLQAEVQGALDEPGEPGPSMEDGEEEDEIRPGGAEDVELARLDDELLGQDRH